MKKRKQGFTLIELLAVIVIIAIIALISVPVLINIINDSRKGAFKASVQSVFKAYETYELKNPTIEEKVSILDLPITHKENFTSGKAYKEGNIIKVENVSNGSYCASGTIENLQVIEGSCDILDTTAPVIENVMVDSMTSSVKVYTTYLEEESFLSKHEYRIALISENIEEKEWINGDTLTGNLSTKTFSGLTLGTTYKIQIRLTNTSLENNVSEIKEMEVTTLTIEKPVITLLTSGEYATSREIKITYPIGTGLFYEYNIDGTWERTEEKEKTITIEENKTVRARVSDGTNTIEAETLTISGIDKTEPTIRLTKEVVENKNVLKVLVEPESTLSGYTYTWYKDGNIIEGETANTLIVTEAGVYKGKVTTGAGKESISDEINIGSYMINYDLTGGTGNIENQTKIEDLELALTNTIPTKEGHHFVGWRASEEDIVNYKAGDPYTENKNVTLYAVWSHYGIKIEDLYENIYVRNLSDGKLYSVFKENSHDDYFFGNYDRVATLNDVIKTTGYLKLNPAPYATNDENLSIVNEGENTYELMKDVSLNAWVQIHIRAAGGTIGVEISNFKLNFEDGSSWTLQQAVENQYVEPLVIISSNSTGSNYLWADIINIKNGGASGIASYPQVYILFKTKEKSALKSYSFTSNREFKNVSDGTLLREFENMDLSIEN